MSTQTLTTAAAVAPGAAPQYAVERSVFAAGAAVQWLREGLGVIDTPAETELLASQVDSTDGVYLVPALSGLGAPLMQFQSDLIGAPVEVAAETESTALGASVLAGLAVGLWPAVESVAARVRREVRYEPRLAPEDVAERREEWRLALRRATLR